MKKLTLSILIFLLSISFVACSSANTPSQGSSASESTDSNSSIYVINIIIIETCV